MRKRRLSLILIIFMMLCMICTSFMSLLQVNAEGSGDSISRELWIHRLVETFELTVEENSTPDNYYPDLLEDDEYYADMIAGIQYGLLDVAAGENVEPQASATREFAAHTLNLLLNYQLTDNTGYSFSDAEDCIYPEDDQVALNQGWLSAVNGKFMPASEITEAEADRMIADAIEVLAGDVIEENYENTYELNLAPGTVEIPEGTEYLWLDSETLQIIDCPVTLAAGKDFVIHMGDILGIYHAKSVSYEAPVTTVTVERVEDENLVTDIDAQGQLDLSNIYVESGEDMDLYYIDTGTGESYESLPDMIHASTMSTKGSIDLKNVKIKGSGKIKLDDTFSVQLGFSFSDPKLEYKINAKDKEVKVRLTGKLEVNYKVEASASEFFKTINDTKLFFLGIPGIGGLAVNAKLEAKASIGGKLVNNVDMTIKYEDGCIRLPVKFTNNQHCVTAEATGAIGVKVSLGINDVPGNIIVADAYVEGGGKASIKSESYADGKTPVKCVHFAAYLYAEAGFEGKIKFFWGEVGDSIYKVIFDDKNSPAKIVKHYEDGRQVPECTRGKEWDDKYYTGGGSIFSDSGWSGGDNSWLLGPGGEPYCIFGYYLDDDGNAVINSYEGNMRSLTIPDTLDDYKVVGIDDNVFAGNSLITTVTFPESVKFIDNKAFMGCSNLSWINFASGLETIGTQTFAGCSSLAMIELPSTVVTINAGAFARCADLSRVILSENLVRMDAHAFFDDDRLTSIEIPKTLKEGNTAYIYEYAYDYQWGPFYGCDGLKTITFAQGSTEITSGLFANCPGIEEINVPDTITTIESSAFRNCKNLAGINLTDGLTTIGSVAFANNPSITSVTIPDSVTTIDAGAFGSCENLSYVKLSDGLIKMNAHAFYNDDLITAIEIPKTLKEGNTAYLNEFAYDYQWGPFYGCDGLKTITFGKGTTEITQGLFANCPGIEEINIPDTVTVIEGNSFQNCKNLTKINFTDGLTQINSQAFANCSKLTEVIMPDTVVLVDSGAFAKCAALEKVTLSKTLRKMNAHAFFDDDMLAEVFIPKSLKEGNTAYIYEYAYDYQWGPFYGCDGLKKVVFEEGVTEITQGLFAHCGGIEEIVIPDTVTVLESDCFLQATGLKKVTLSKNLETLSTSSFNGCKSLESIEIPDSVTSMGSYVCNGCSSLKSAKLPSTLTYVRDHTFSECSSLESITLPEPVTRIDKEAFMNCTSLAEINWNSNITEIGFYAFENNDSLTEVIIPEGVKTIVKGAFYDCDSLTKVVIPDTVTSMGERVFYTCELLKDVKLSSGLTSIPTETFYECPSLEEITIPYGVTKIEGTAFANCTSLVKITIPRTVTAINTAALSYPAKTVIYGVAGTYAETFANENGFKFVAIDIPATSVTLSETDLMINRYQTYKVKLTIEPADCTDEISWKSSDTDIVTVDNGSVYGVAVGTATVKVSVGSKSASVKVTVVQPVTSINLSTYSRTMEALETYQFTATVNPSNAYNKTIEWSSSDPAVATVDETGLVTALTKGTATIKASATDGSNISRTATITVKNNAYICTSADELESPHDYPANSSDYWVYTSEGAEKLYVTFDERTFVEDGFDYIYIYDGEGNEIGKYTGAELAGKTIEIPGDTIRIKLVSDDGDNGWGFKVTDLQAVGAHDHVYGTPQYTWTDDNKSVTAKAVCTVCGDEISETVNTTYAVITEPTETETGLGRYTAVFTNELFETQTKDVVIPPKDHEHEYGAPEYTWSADNSTVTARLICKSCGDVISETVSTSYQVISKPTCTDKGLGRYTAIFTNELFKTQTKDVEIDALGHKYELTEWKWSKDYTEAQAVFTCQNDKSHTQTVDAVVTIDGDKATATVTFEGKTYTDVKEIPAAPQITVTLNKTEADIPTQSTLQLTANVDVTWTSSDEEIATVDQNGKVTALRYGKVTITATAQADSNAYATCEIQTRFYDVNDSSKYYYTPVYWAADKEITTGYDRVYFGPQKNCTRQELAIFLWRLAGKPAVSGTLPFSDTKYDKSSASFQAILWCSQQGIVRGYNDGTFKPKANVSRKDTLIMLYRLAGKPDVSGTIKFPDVLKENYDPNSDTYKAILWGVQNGITNGYKDGNFQPKTKCLREHIVTFIYRADKVINN